MKAFVFDPLWRELISDEGKQMLANANIETVVVEAVSPIKECIELYEGDEERVICVNPDYVQWNLKADDYKDIPNLRAVLGEATSFSWVDMSYANQQNIPVCNIRGFSSQAVAEWAVLMMMNVARRVPELIKDSFPLDFDADYMKYRGVELHSKTAAIIGLGRIGEAIAERCAGLGMRVVYWSKDSRSDTYEYVDLERLFREADVVFPVMAVNDESRNIITTSLLDTLKVSAILIDIVDDLFDRRHVLDMVAGGKLVGYGFEAQPGQFNAYAGNVWAAPAYGWVTDNSMNDTISHTIQNMVFASKGQFPHRVNDYAAKD